MKLTNHKWLCGAGRQMSRSMGALVLVMGVLCAAWTRQAYAAVSTTTVQGTVYLANGEPGSGMLHVSWPAFTTANGQAIVADSADVTIGQDGFLSVNLAANEGASPGGLYYTAVYYMSDGTVSTQYWVVPAAAQASLAQVQAQVMPVAQAVQAVNKTYVDQAIAQISQSMLTGSGGTLTGPLYLSGDPTQSLQAADKHYVDLAVSQAGSSTVNPASPGQVAYYGEDGSSISGMSTVPVSAGGTGGTTANDALQNLGGLSATASSAQTMAGPLNLSGPYDSSSTNPNQAATAQNVQNVAPRSVKEFGAKGDGKFSDFKMTAGSHTVQLVDLITGEVFSAGDVGKRILIPNVDSDHKTLYTTITAYTDSSHVTVAASATYSFDGTGTWTNQVLWGTDDLAAINTAMAALGDGRTPGAGLTREGGGSLVFPCGYYLVSGQIQISNHVNFEGINKDCSIIVDTGTSTHDATIEIANNAYSSWLVNGLYMNPSYNNHPEIGACSGGGCSPALNAFMSSSVSNLSIYSNKFASWALASISTSQTAGENVNMYGGGKGCFYTLNQVNVTYTHYQCSPGAFGTGNPINGFYLDGSAPGAGTVPMHLEAPWITNTTATGFTSNFAGGVTVTNPQMSLCNKSINLMANGGGITFVDGLFEGSVTADIIAGDFNIFQDMVFSGAGATVSGKNNMFKGGGFSYGTALTVTGVNNSFENTAMGEGTTVEDSSQTSHYSSLYDVAANYIYNRPVSEDAVQSGGGGTDIQAITRVTGMWKADTTPHNVTNTTYTVGQAWRAIFTCDWLNYGVQQDVPAIVELTDTSNTVTVGSATFTFTLASNGHFQVVANTSDIWIRFTGIVVFMPRGRTAGNSGVNSVKYANNVQAPSVQVGTGAAVTDNQGNGAKLQHSTGSTASGHLAKFDANGNVVDAGAGYPNGTIDPAAKTTYFNDFYTSADTQSSSIGSPTGSSCGVSSSNPGSTDTPGLLTVSSGTGSTGSGVSCFQQAFGHPVIPPATAANRWTWKEVLTVPVLPGTKAAQYAVGLSRYSTATQPLGFVLDSADGNPNHWYCRNFATGSPVDSGVTATTGGAALSMTQDGTYVHWYINGAEVCSPVALGSINGGNNVAVDFLFGGAATQVAGTAATMQVDYVQYSATVTRP